MQPIIDYSPSEPAVDPLAQRPRRGGQTGRFAGALVVATCCILLMSAGAVGAVLFLSTQPGGLRFNSPQLNTNSVFSHLRPQKTPSTEIIHQGKQAKKSLTKIRRRSDQLAPSRPGVRQQQQLQPSRTTKEAATGWQTKRHQHRAQQHSRQKTVTRAKPITNAAQSFAIQGVRAKWSAEKLRIKFSLLNRGLASQHGIVFAEAGILKPGGRVTLRAPHSAGSSDQRSIKGSTGLAFRMHSFVTKHLEFPVVDGQWQHITIYARNHRGKLASYTFPLNCNPNQDCPQGFVRPKAFF